MKKILVFLIIVLLGYSCSSDNKSKSIVCADSYQNAYELFVEAVESKDIQKLKELSATYIPYFDTIAIIYDKPEIKLIPKQKDGAFGTFDKENNYIYYIFLSDNNQPKEVKVIDFKKDGSCYKIWNFTSYSLDNELIKIYDKTYNQPKKKEFARVTTTDDTGYKSNNINLWSSTDNKRIVVDKCVNNEVVEVLDYSDPYIKVRKKNGKEGWFLEGWIKEYLNK